MPPALASRRQPEQQQAEPVRDLEEISVLNSWTQGPVKEHIAEFLTGSIAEGEDTFIPPGERIAVFDVDGTIFVEKPNYGEVLVGMKRLCDLHREDPASHSGPIYTNACALNYDFFNGNIAYTALLQAFLGETQTFYRDYVDQQLLHFDHPRFEIPLGRLVYEPMRELIEWLAGEGFRVYLVSGSEQGFVRTLGEQVFGFSFDRGLGNRVALTYNYDAGTSTFIRQNEFLDPGPDGQGKPEVIWEDIGGDPVVAFGNTMGDFEMLEFTSSHRPYPTLRGIIVHDDPIREYEYYDAELQQEATKAGWLQVSMRRDFATMFKAAPSAS